MKYEIEKHSISLKTRFSIKDTESKELYYAEEKGLFINKKLIFFDDNNNQIGKLVNVNMLKGIYELYIEKKLRANILKPSFKKGYKINLPASVTYDVDPQSMTMNFKVSLEEVQKAKFYQTNYIAPARYEVEIEGDEDQQLLLFSIIAVIKLVQK